MRNIKDFIIFDWLTKHFIKPIKNYASFLVKIRIEQEEFLFK